MRRFFVPLGLLCMLFLLLAAASAGSVPRAQAAPTVTITGVSPSIAANDLDVDVTVVGTGLSSVTGLALGSTQLRALDVVDDTRIDAVLPWGAAPGVYTLTAEGAGGPVATLPDAITVTLGLGVWQAGELYGGDVQHLAVNPLTPATLYAGAESVGLFRSRDGGAHWTFIHAQDAGDVAVDPVDPTRIYLGWYNTVSRSDDGGDTWTDLPDAPGNQVFLHPTSSGTLFAIAGHHDVAGLWRSSDYGATWITPTEGLTDTWVSDLAFDPTDPLTVVAGTTSGNLFVSTDGGDHWTFAARPVENVQTLAFNPRGGHELWVSDCCFCTPQTLTSLDPGFTSFTETLDASLTAIAFPDPLRWGAATSQTVYAAGCWDEDYVTYDGGAGWSPWGPDVGGWGWSLALDPDSPGTIYKSSHQYGVLKTINAGVTWSITNEGLTAMAPEQLATVPGKPEVVYATAEGWTGVLRSDNGGGRWQFMPIPQAGEGVNPTVLVDPYETDRIYAGGHEAVYRSDDGGASWSLTGTLPIPPACTVNLQTVEVSTLAADPMSPGNLLAGANVLCNDFSLQMGAIYLSDDYGVTWAQAMVPDTTAPVLDVAYDVAIQNMAYATTEGSGMLRSTDGGQTWQPIGTSVPGLAEISELAQHPSAPYWLYAQTKGGSWNGLYGSDDHGETWTLLAPWLHAQALLMVDGVPPTLYAGADFGLIQSTNAVSWSVTAGDVARVPIYALAAAHDGARVVLYAGTTGGVVAPGGVRTSATQAAGLLAAGVYRHTQQVRRVMLPLVLRP